MERYRLPDCGLDLHALRERFDVLEKDDWSVRNGRLPLHCYYANDEVDRVSDEAHQRFSRANALAPEAFPSCLQMEAELVSMALELLNGGTSAAGSVTSGGTESIILALKAARDAAASTWGVSSRQNIVIPESAHPAFDKGAHLLGLDVIRVATRSDLRCDVDAMKAAMDANTIFIVGSAPSLPFGLIDPIADLGDLALRHGVWLHVDGCIGGLLAPFVRALGYPIPLFDFAVPGVRSISADLHKFGYAAKGASLILYRSASDHQFQFSRFSNWPKGDYFTPTLSGTRSGGPIAAAWAVMHYLGRNGYLDVTRALMQLRDRHLEGYRAQCGLSVVGQPDLTVISVESSDLDIFSIADCMRHRGWYMSLVARPAAIQRTVNLVHEASVDAYFEDLGQAVADARMSSIHAPLGSKARRVVTY
ncbi:aminotransferase class I/II-fold pyridoxal phosphate-dependent enzyme [Xanthomonas sacchari]|uniref:pyridoxal phosphate-dependent decarboxylase family protein n=1 Tax=Xanthomonas sacchari TaxID=56458 RepID=UPI0022571271|nr:aminotransferase class I/II-fold pyridoxal phosphate-dependent enzyme [Xanthomonas sacchari]UYK86701.1 aminotransferase class I/II-fold pyridoxal phosphate-dependent enzyme [Xanthomonas sacchari]